MHLKNVLSFQGKASRFQYAVFALPILLVIKTSSFAMFYLPLIVAFHGPTLEGMIGWQWLIPTAIILNLLLVPLSATSVRRLNDLGFSGWLAVPYSLPLLLAFTSAFFEPVISSEWKHILSGLAWVCNVYGLLLVLPLVALPGRKNEAILTA